MKRCIAVALLLCSFAGCCPHESRELPKLPPAISLAEQLADLPASLQVPRFRGKIAPNGIKINSIDKKGEKHSLSTDGILLIRQHETFEADGGRNPADVLLVARILEKEVLQAGRNSNDWWIIDRQDPATIWIGSAKNPVQNFPRGDATDGKDAANAADLSGTGLPRPDLIPALLGLSRWSVQPRNPEEVVSWKVDDITGTNDLTICRRPDAQDHTAPPIREIVIDRRTNRVVEVRFYNAAGVMIMGSMLSDFREAANDETPQTKGPLVPYRATIYYPAQQITIGLEFGDVSIPIPARMPDAMFKTPENQNLRVIHVE